MKTAAAILLLAAGAAFGQDKPQDDHQDLTPEKALQLLKEAQELMTRSEDLLHDSARGKSVETEEAILKRIDELLKEDPAASQKKTLEKIGKLMSKSEGSQKDAIERMAEILRKAKS